MAKPPAYPPPVDSLLDLACREGVDVRPTLLRVLTDLYVQKPSHTADEETQYVELALGLIHTIDAPTRAAVAASLSGYAAAPAAILATLASLDGAVADMSPLDVPEIEAPPLAPTRPEPAFRAPPTDERIDLFFAATSEERRLILANLDVGGSTPRLPTPPMSDTIVRLETAALQRNQSDFSRALERALGISRALANRITQDDSGEPLVVAAKALAMPAAVLQRVLLFLNPEIGQSVQRVFELAQLFDELSPEAAQQMTAVWQTTGTPRRPVHEPVYADDERRSARSTATPSRHRTARTRDEVPSRPKTGGR
jgi:uncharacterized protein (DUF2336 family)